MLLFFSRVIVTITSSAILALIWEMQLTLAQFVVPKSQELITTQLMTVPLIQKIEVQGSTAFSPEELESVLSPFKSQAATVETLLALRRAVTQLYVKHGYTTSGAFLPPNQNLKGGIIKIQVIEGKIEAFEFQGLKRLNHNYVKNRLQRATDAPLNTRRLEEAIQLLQFDPLISNVQAELSPGSSPGLSILTVKVKEADSFVLQLGVDNNRSRSVGSDGRGILLSEGNLFGGGEHLEGGYFNSDGSNSFFVRSSLPVNPQNGTVGVTYGKTFNEIISEPFNRLNLETDSTYYDLTFRQPIIQSPNQELEVGISATYTVSEGFFDGERFPLSRGADEQGKTKISALRFLMEWTARSRQDVISLRSQFNLGLEFLDVTTGIEPDAEFFDWVVEAQYARQLAPDTLFLLKGRLQLATEPLLPDEQFRLGGFDSVRGYRKDVLLSDNGFLASAELRWPVWRIEKWQGVLQIVPFVDVGKGWNVDDFPLVTDILVSTGLGLVWQQGENFSANVYWGFPVEPVDENLRENQVSFFVRWSLF